MTDKFSLHLTSNSSYTDHTDLSQGEFSLKLNRPIMIPPNLNPYIYLSQAGIWNYFLNISSTIANNKIYYTNDYSNLTKYNITIPDGYYTASSLGATINDLMISAGHTTIGFSLEENLAQQKVKLIITGIGWAINWASTTPYTVVGYDLNDTSPPTGLTTASYFETAPNIAAFSSLTEINVHCNLISEFCSMYAKMDNNSPSDILEIIQPNVSVGSLINYKPYFKSTKPLNTNYVQYIRIQLTNELNAPLNLSTENFYLTLVIGW